MHTFAALL